MKNPSPACLLALSLCAPAFAQRAAPLAAGAVPGTAAEPVQILNYQVADQTRHDGALSPAIGVETIQVFRANREHKELADDYGFCYNHQPYLCYWNDTYYLEWLGNTYGEQVAPGHSSIITSKDGRNWSKPKVVFPIYYLDVPPFHNATGEPGMAIMHQRMGWYIAHNGRLIVSGFYGGTPSPFGPGGIGRVVREVHKDGTFGPVYFIKYNQHYRKVDHDEWTQDDPKLAGWNEANTGNPYTPGEAPMPVLFYKHSPDSGFVEACDELLASPLVTMQWWEEEAEPATLFKVVSPRYPEGHMQRWEAPSIFHRKDGTAVSCWKWSGVALSTDEGRTWSDPVAIPSIITAGAKVWGQKMSDGRYALVYNPSQNGYFRFPLAVVTSDDGITFDHMLLVDGDVYPRRYMGRAKDYGFQYIRGIEEWNGRPPNTDMWLTYSTKEDIWVARVPVPVKGEWQGPVSDNFDNMAPGGNVTNWNLRHGPWMGAEVAAFPNASNHSLQLSTRDPYNYAKGERVFAQGASKSISCKVYAHQTDTAQLNVEVENHTGRSPVRIVFGKDGLVWVNNGAKAVDAGPYKAGAWHSLAINVNGAAHTFDATLDGKQIASGAAFMEDASDVNRLCFRTGDLYTLPIHALTAEGREDPAHSTSRDIGQRDVLNAGDPLPKTAVFNIDDVTVN